MNVKNLIESGQIELYVAGALSQDEKRLIDEILNEYPEVADEIKEVEDSWNNFALAYSRNPRPLLRKKIIDGIVREGAKVYSFSGDDDNDANDGSDIKWWLTAAAMGLLIMVSALNYMFYMKWTEAENELLKIKTANKVESVEAKHSGLSETLK